MLADHLSPSDVVAGRVLAVLLPLLLAGFVAVVADAVVPFGRPLLGGRRPLAVVVMAGATGLVAAFLLPGHEGLADWIG